MPEVIAKPKKAYAELRTKNAGYTKVWNDKMLRRFRADLEALLEAAGYEGPFSVRQNGVLVKGAAHLSGITIGTATGPHWVEICAQYGDNSSRDTWRIFFPHEDTSADLAALKAALVRPAVADKSSAVRVVVNNDDPADESSSETEEPAVGEALPERSAPSLFDNEDDLKLFLMFVFERSGKQAVLERSLVSKVLTGEFNLSGRALGPVYRRLTGRQALFASEGESSYRMTEAAFRLIGLSVPPSEESMNEAPLASLSLSDKLALLEEEASAYDQIESDILAGEARKAALCAELTDLEAALAPLYEVRERTRSAKAKLEQLHALLAG
jgi:hypothetical protein